MLEKINKQSTAEMYLKKRKNIYQASRLQLQVCRPQRSWQRECGKWKCVGGGIFQVHSRIKGRCVGGVSNFKEYVSVCVHAHTHHTHGIRTLVHTHTHQSTALTREKACIPIKCNGQRPKKMHWKKEICMATLVLSMTAQINATKRV